jgi:hypothetical protein
MLHQRLDALQHVYFVHAGAALRTSTLGNVREDDDLALDPHADFDGAVLEDSPAGASPVVDLHVLASRDGKSAPNPPWVCSVLRDPGLIRRGDLRFGRRNNSAFQASIISYL